MKSNQSCPRCGESFTCDIQNDKTSCWCFDLPNIIPLSDISVDSKPDEGCLCPQCLQEKIVNRIGFDSTYLSD